MGTLPRKIENKIKPFLSGPGLVAIFGPRRAGKTTLLKQMIRDMENRPGDGKSVLLFSLDDAEHLSAFNKDPGGFRDYCLFNGADPEKEIVVFVDDIHDLDNPSRFLTRIARTEPNIKLIVSSASLLELEPEADSGIHSAQSMFQLNPLDFEEFLLFKGNAKLNGIKKQYQFRKVCEEDFQAGVKLSKSVRREMETYFEEFVLYGGYPEVVLAKSKKEKLARLKSLIEMFELKSVNLLFNVSNMKAFRSFFKLLAADSGELLNVNALARTLGIGRDTVRRYLNVLERSFIAKSLSPFHHQHPKELTKMPKFYFNDTGMRNYAISNFSDLKFRPDKERLFKNTIGSELTKNLGRDESLFFWRTISRNQVDFVISGEQPQAFNVKALPNAAIHNSSGFRAFRKLYPNCRRYVINYEHFSNENGKTLLPGWMV